MPYFFMSTMLLTEVWKKIRFWSNFRQVSNKKLGLGGHRFRFLCLFYFLFFCFGFRFFLLDITMYKHTPKIIRQEPSYKQMEIKTNRTSFLCGNLITYHSMELSTYKQSILNLTIYFNLTKFKESLWPVPLNINHYISSRIVTCYIL